MSRARSFLPSARAMPPLVRWWFGGALRWSAWLCSAPHSSAHHFACRSSWHRALFYDFEGRLLHASISEESYEDSLDDELASRNEIWKIFVLGLEVGAAVVYDETFEGGFIIY